MATSSVFITPSRILSATRALCLLGFGAAQMACGSSKSDEICDDQACDSSDGEDSGSGSDAAMPDEPTGAGIPCEVAEVLAARCGMCHADPPSYGAPMSLASLEDFRAPAVSDPEHTVADVSQGRLLSEVMPMPPGGDISDEDKDVLLDWLAAGTPASPVGEDTCDLEEGEGEPVGPESLPCEPNHTIVARADGSNDPFHVPAGGSSNLYQCFTFASTFDEDDQAIAFAPITDDERVIHHWLLFRETGDFVDGASFPCDGNMIGGAANRRTLLMGWAPGGLNFVAPDDVGLELPGPDEHFLLQVHYHNAAGYTDAYDSSGVAICTIDEPRVNEAATLTLGTLDIDVPPGESAEVSGTCDTGQLSEPITLLASFPHMHRIGTSIATTRETASGATEAIVEVDPWDFENQIYYMHEDAVVEPGDKLVTTCNYTNTSSDPVTFGEETEDEMCFNFVMVYPISAVDEAGNGNRRCLGVTPGD